MNEEVVRLIVDGVILLGVLGLIALIIIGVIIFCNPEITDAIAKRIKK